MKRRQDRRPLVAAHRGAWGPEPQNSLAAFRRALALGVEMVELDVRLTRDGFPVVVHDRAMGGVPVARLAWRELCAMDPAVPLLDEVLRQCAGRLILDLEIKVEEAVDPILELIKAGPRDGFLLTSFLPGAVETVRRRDARLSTGLVADCGDPGTLAAYCREAGHRSLFLHFPLLPRRGQLSGVELFAWTVNGTAALVAAFQRGDLTGVVTDEPEAALKARASIIQTGYNVRAPHDDRFRNSMKP